LIENIPLPLREGLVRILLVVLTLIVTFLLRKLVLWLLTQPLHRLFERTGQLALDAKIRAMIILPVNYVLAAMALILCAHILNLSPALLEFASNLSSTMVLIAIGVFLVRLINAFTLSQEQLTQLTGLSIDELLIPFFRTTAKFLVVAIIVIVAMQQWGYDMTAIIAAAGVGALAVSLAAQDTLANLIGFAAIISDKPFIVGDMIKTPNVEGIVETIGLRATRVRQQDEALVAVPNRLLAESAILNWSRLSKRRINLTLGVTYDAVPEDMEALLHSLREMLLANKFVEQTSVVVYFNEFGSSALNILVRCYLNIIDWTEFTAEQERVLIEIRRLVDETGLDIAFPTQTLHIETMPSESSAQKDLG
jgi:MscS family membrane protein